MAAVFDSSSSFSTLPSASDSPPSSPFRDPYYGDILSAPSPPPSPPENISSPKPGSEEGLVAESGRRSENLKPSESDRRSKNLKTSESVKSQSKRRLRKRRHPVCCLDIDNYEIGDIRSALTLRRDGYWLNDSDDDHDDVSKRVREEKPIDPPDIDDHVVPPMRSPILWRGDPTVVSPIRSPILWRGDGEGEGEGEGDDDDDDEGEGDKKDPDLLNDVDHIDDGDRDGRPNESGAEVFILKPGMFNCGVCGSLDHPCLMCPYWHDLPPNPKIGPRFQLACDLCGRCGDKVTKACKFLRLVRKIDHRS